MLIFCFPTHSNFLFACPCDNTHFFTVPFTSSFSFSFLFSFPPCAPCSSSSSLSPSSSCPAYFRHLRFLLPVVFFAGVAVVAASSGMSGAAHQLSLNAGMRHDSQAPFCLMDKASALESEDCGLKCCGGCGIGPSLFYRDAHLNGIFQ